MKRYFPTWAIICLILFCSGTIALRLWIVQETYKIDLTQKQIKNLSLERDHSKLAVEKLRAPDRLRELARSKFHLVPVQNTQIIYIEEPTP